MDSIEERLALPFYLKMMGTNATRNAHSLWDDLVRVGRGATSVQVQQLLAPDHWRPVIMGAWFSLGFAPDQVGGELLAAMERSRGSLTAPPLAIACALVLGRDAGFALASYVELDAARDGSAAFVAGVHELFCGASSVDISDRDSEAVVAMLDVGERFRSALTGG